MEPKKNREYSLERSRTSFFLLGLCFSTALVLSAFEWRTEVDQGASLGCPDYETDLTDEPTMTVPVNNRPKPKLANQPVVDVYELVKELNEEQFQGKSKESSLDLSIDNLFDLDYSVEVIPEDKLPPLPSTPPVFPGGVDALNSFLRANIKYPPPAKRWGVQGVVWVTFLVDKDGKVSNINISRGIGMGCDEEAMRVVGLMPDWIPGKQRGIPVEVMYKLPVKFTML